MNTQRGWFLIIGLLVCLLLGAAVYLLLPARKPLIVAPNSPDAVAKTPVPLPSSSEGALTAPPADTAPSFQPQSGSAPAPTYQYNARGQLQAIIYPDGSVYTYVYDAYGDKIRETSGTGKTWVYAYDQSHHPITVIDPQGHITHQEASPGPPDAK